MGQNTVINYFSNQKLVPAEPSDMASKSRLVVALPPGVSIVYGTLLVPPAAVGSADVQTITAPGSGTYTLSGTNPLTGNVFTTSALAFNANDAAVAAAINAVIGAGASVAVASLAVTFGGNLAMTPVPLMSTTAGSVAHTTVGVAPGTWTVYAGSGKPTALLEYTSTTDTSGNVSNSSSAGGGEHYETELTASAFTKGHFYCSDIPNIDTNAITMMGGRLQNAQSTSTPGAMVYFP